MGQPGYQRAKDIPANAPTIDVLHSMVFPEPNSGCWIWTGTLVDGYGLVTRRSTLVIPAWGRRAHRLAYIQKFGPLPLDVCLDHLCRTRCCVNPDHLEPVSNRENMLRGLEAAGRILRGVADFVRLNPKTHCLHGHPLSGDNLFVNKRGIRVCRACRKRRVKAARLKRKAI